MDKIDLAESHISHVITHFVGNRGKAQTLKLSSGLTFVPVDTWDFFKRYLFSSFKLEEYFGFHHKEALEMNSVYSIVQNIFTDQSTFVDDSSQLAELLYEVSVHPKVEEGELTVVYMKNIKIGENFVDAVGIFKSESESAFLKYNHKESHYEVSTDFGYDVNKVDKGCLIINTNAEDGYDVVIVDHKSKGEEARFWKDSFLGLKPIENDFFQTKVAMEVAKSFVESPITSDLEMGLTEQIELLNKSSEYFQNTDSFERGTFEEAVFNNDENLVMGFRNYEENLSAEQNIEFPTNFEISKPAVKKNNKIFRSILKLDKNFSIYIHGDRDRAERGEDDNGKFYKFYYDEERYE